MSKPKTKFGPIVEHAGTGLRMPEKMARQIDADAKGLPKDFTYRRVAKSTDKFRCDPGERTDVSTITTADVDRDGECILPDGIDFGGYNRAVPFAHDYDSLPVGACWWINRDGNGLSAKTHYAPKPPDWGDAPWPPSAVLHLMQQQVPTCTGKSVGVQPLLLRSATREEIAANPKMKSATVIARCKLYEYSVAPVPVNPMAEMQVVSKCEREGLVAPEFAALIRKSLQRYSHPTKSMPTPNPGESEKDYVHRCIPVVLQDGSAKNQDQAVAMCYSMYREHHKAMSKPNDHDEDDQPIVVDTKGKYAHIDFKAPKEVQKAHREGVERHEAGESKGHATPEQVAMARHIGAGGEASPEYARKAHAYHSDNPHHVTAKPGTPAYALAMLHGGNPGREHYKATVKSMDEADAGPGPGTAIDENGGPVGMAVKSEGAAENSNPDGGYTVPEGISKQYDKAEPPKCPDCDSNEHVTETGERMEDGVKVKMYECSMCGKTFDGDDQEDSTEHPAEGVEQDEVAAVGNEPPGHDKPFQKSQAKTKSEKGTVTVNRSTVSRAESLAAEGKYTEEKWDAPNGGDRKPADCLGTREGKDVPPSERCVCPVIKDGKLYVHAVADAESRESGTPVGEAAAAIMRRIQEHRDKSKTKALTKEQIEAAAERMVAGRMAELQEKAMQKAADQLELMLGGV